MAPRSDLSLLEKSPAKAQNIQGNAPSRSSQQTLGSPQHRHTCRHLSAMKMFFLFLKDILICINVSGGSLLCWCTHVRTAMKGVFLPLSPHLRPHVPSNRIQLHIIACWHHPASSPSCFAGLKYLMHVFACSHINIQTEHSHLTVNVAM